VSETRTRRARSWQACRLLLRYAAAGWKGWAFLIAATLVSTGLGLLRPWPMKILVDHVLRRQPMAAPLTQGVRFLPGGGNERGLLVWIVLAGLVIFLAGSLTDVLLTRTWIRVGQRMVYNLAGDLFAHLQRRSLLFHGRTPVGDSLSRITGDSWCIYKLVDALLFSPAAAGIMAIGMVVLMAVLDPRLTLLALAVAPFMAGSSFLLRGPLRATVRARREIEARIQSHVQRSLSGIQVVQAFTQEERERQRFGQLTEDALRVQRCAILLTNLRSLASGLIATLGTAAVLWLGARHVLDGSLHLGSLLMFLAYLGSLQGHLKMFTDLYTALQEVGIGTERILEVLESDLEVTERPGAAVLPPVRGHVRLEGVTFGYEPGRPVLRGVSLDVLPGQTVAIVGPTGAGKSTLVSLVPRFFDPWEGRVLLDGHDLRDVRLKSVRGQVGIVFQEPFLFPFTVAENIAYGRPGAARAEIKAAAQAANLEKTIARLPHGYDTVLGERGATLSGGERQRLSIARAFLKDAPVLILDEPTSALDAHTEQLLLEALQRLVKGRTTFLIAHRLSTVRHADRILVLQGGEVVEAGTHAELLGKQGAYARLHSLQGRPPSESVCSVGARR
jgi:ATP-binding cassette, subfamily B, bacterial